MAKKFLVLPINDSLPMKPVFLRSEGRLLQDVQAAVDPEHPVFEAYLDITRFGDVPVAAEDGQGAPVPFRLADRLPEPEEIPHFGDFRPGAHFTAGLGWINDPNGLVLADGVYHLFYQHNPLGCRWENMTWGHAVSRDLLHWQHWGDALFPDEMGSEYSGSGIQDREDVSGLGAGALLLFYTAAGDSSVLSRDRRFTQCLAWSADGGRTFRKYEKNPVVAHRAASNRDPKVQWSEELGKYVMALYLEKHTYEILTSGNLLDWTPLQTLDMPLDWECPDFFPLTADDGTRRWVFCGACDSYLVGDLDSRGFRPVQQPRYLQIQPGISYAAQTFSGTEPRRIRIYWQQVTPPEGVFCSQMSLPMELSLVKRQGEYRLCLAPVEEWDRALEQEVLDYRGTGEKVLARACGAVDAEFRIPSGCGSFSISCRGAEVRVDPAGNTYSHRGGASAPLSEGGGQKLRLIFDTLSAEGIAADGLVYTSAEAPGTDEPLVIRSEEEVSLQIRIGKPIL